MFNKRSQLKEPLLQEHKRQEDKIEMNDYKVYTLQEHKRHEHKIEMNDSKATPRNDLEFPNSHLQLYFLNFLDTEALAIYLFLNSRFFKAVHERIQKMTPELQRPFLHGLGNIAYQEETKKLIEECLAKLRAELKEPIWRTTSRHASWFVPSVGGTGALIYGAINRIAAAKFAADAKNTLRASLIGMKECAGFFVETVCKYYWHNDTPIPYDCKKVETDLCAGSIMQGCESSWGDENCYLCYTPCTDLRTYNGDFFSASFGLGSAITGAVVFSLGATYTIMQNKHKIQNWYKQSDRKVENLSQDLQRKLQQFGIAADADAQYVVDLLETQRRFINNGQHKTNLTARLVVAFGVFHSTLSLSYLNEKDKQNVEISKGAIKDLALSAL